MKYISLLFLVVLMSCKPKETTLTAQQIIDKTLSHSGASKISNSIISFNFRDKSYRAERKNGVFKLTRMFDSIEDVVTNLGFERYIHQKKQELSSNNVFKYANSVNSVHYFSVLPYGLNDKAVQKTLLPSVSVKGKEYYKVEVTFSKEGGGNDFEDVFVYWIGKDDFLVDFLAYSYHTNQGGMRFRALKKQCVKNGVRFVDYINYKPLSKDTDLLDIDIAFEKNQLKKVSEIILKDIQVTIL